MRKEGYHWVKYKGEWFIGHWRKIPGVSELHMWYLPGWANYFRDGHFDEIDETPILRNTGNNNVVELRG